MDAEQLKQRTKRFAVRVIHLVRALPRTKDGNAIGSQLVRSGTAVGANYRAACKARSRKEFIARIGVVEEEADESAYWLELITEAEMMPTARVDPLLQEAYELTRIAAASRTSAAAREAEGNE